MIKRDGSSSFPERRDVGVPQVYLDALSYLMELAEDTPLVNFRGDACGEVRVEIKPTVAEPQERIESRADHLASGAEEANLKAFVGQFFR